MLSSHSQWRQCLRLLQPREREWRMLRGLWRIRSGRRRDRKRCLRCGLKRSRAQEDTWGTSRAKPNIRMTPATPRRQLSTPATPGRTLQTPINNYLVTQTLEEKLKVLKQIKSKKNEMSASPIQNKHEKSSRSPGLFGTFRARESTHFAWNSSTAV